MELTFKQKWYALTSIMLSLSPWVSSKLLSLSNYSPLYIQFKRTNTSDTSWNYNTQDPNLICGYLFNDQTVGMHKRGREPLVSNSETLSSERENFN